MGWLKDFFESTDKASLSEMLPGVRDVEQHSCFRCGEKGYVRVRDIEMGFCLDSFFAAQF